MKQLVVAATYWIVCTLFLADLFLVTCSAPLDGRDDFVSTYEHNLSL